VDRLACPLVNGVRRLDHVVLNVAANTVLRAEERRQLKFIASSEHVRRMGKTFREHRRLITDEADALAAYRVGPIIQDALDTEPYSLLHIQNNSPSLTPGL